MFSAGIVERLSHGATAASLIDQRRIGCVAVENQQLFMAVIKKGGQDILDHRSERRGAKLNSTGNGAEKFGMAKW